MVIICTEAISSPTILEIQKLKVGDLNHRLHCHYHSQMYTCVQSWQRLSYPIWANKIDYMSVCRFRPPVIQESLRIVSVLQLLNLTPWIRMNTVEFLRVEWRVCFSIFYYLYSQNYTRVSYGHILSAVLNYGDGVLRDCINDIWIRVLSRTHILNVAIFHFVLCTIWNKRRTNNPANHLKILLKW